MPTRLKLTPVVGQPLFPSPDKNAGMVGCCGVSSAVLAPPAEPEKSNLTHCPDFGVHF
jgi:hypothetical protein